MEPNPIQEILFLMTMTNPQPMQLQQPAPASPKKQATAVRDQTAMVP